MWEVSCDGAEKLQLYYYQKLVGSYGGVAALRRVVPDQDVKRWLSEQDTYTLHKPVRRRFKRRCVVVGGPNQQWQADLVDVSRLKKTNDGTAFLLTVIDVFSKRAWCVPLKNKSAVSLVAAFAPLLGDKAPITLQTDKGTEFLNRALQKLLKEYGVHHFATHNEETKASIVERFNRTLKTRMWRYFTKKQSVRYVDVLQDFVRSYNNTFHRTIGMVPSEVNATIQEDVWQRLYGHESVGIPKYRVGDCVRIGKAKRQFKKGYMDRSVVYDRRCAPFRATGLPPGGWARERLAGTFYEPELQKVVVSKDKTYRIEEILRWRNKRREAFVKWFGWPASFNSWVHSSTTVNDVIKNLKRHRWTHMSHSPYGKTEQE